LAPRLQTGAQPVQGLLAQAGASGRGEVGRILALAAAGAGEQLLGIGVGGRRHSLAPTDLRQTPKG
jgi:hypothetical protein